MVYDHVFPWDVDQDARLQTSLNFDMLFTIHLKRFFSLHNLWLFCFLRYLFVIWEEGWIYSSYTTSCTTVNRRLRPCRVKTVLRTKLFSFVIFQYPIHFNCNGIWMVLKYVAKLFIFVVSLSVSLADIPFIIDQKLFVVRHLTHTRHGS